MKTIHRVSLTLLKISALVLLTFIFPKAAQSATVLFYDDFNQYSVGLKSGSLGNWSIAGPSTPPNGSDARQLEILPDTGEWFGEGTANQYLRFSNTGNSTMSMTLNQVLPAGNPVITLSMVLIQPASELTGGIGFRVGKNNTTGADIANIGSITRSGSGVNRMGVVRSTGTTNQATFALDTAMRLDIVFNNGATSISYNNGSLDAGHYDVWIDGERVASGLFNYTANGGYTGDLTSITLRTDSNNPQLMYMDWVAVFAGAQVNVSPIPEPSTAALLSLAAVTACLLIFKTRAKR